MKVGQRNRHNLRDRQQTDRRPDEQTLTVQTGPRFLRSFITTN